MTVETTSDAPPAAPAVGVIHPDSPEMSDYETLSRG